MKLDFTANENVCRMVEIKCPTTRKINISG